ncbi:hypothetical protein PVAND_016448 [Polypedilum vanderplanki]|uniref:Uncharacterized protein n=1 Tax=Polypedilum vanderplanki TaxID=319348 RepID=A0A9J6BFG6_POLVA|nr:hypothetical protein PVAND_016448 [Polypedilum vanderplanki]
MEKWTGKTAVITGGNSGIGAAILSQFIKHGLKVINLDINVTEKDSNFDENSNIFNRKCDVANLDSIKENFKWIEENFGVVHILVNCAGIASLTKLIDGNDENTKLIDKTIDINFRGAVHCAREAMKLMIKSDDYCMIINICSLYGHVIPYTDSSVSVYSCTKYAIRALSEVIRQELVMSENKKIRISNLSPSSVNSNLWTAFGLTKEYMESVNFMKTDDVADAVVYLLSTPYNVNVTEMIIRPVGEKF